MENHSWLSRAALISATALVCAASAVAGSNRHEAGGFGIESTRFEATQGQAPLPNSLSPEEARVWNEAQRLAAGMQVVEAETVFRNWMSQNPNSARACGWLSDFLLRPFWVPSRFDDGMEVAARCLALDDPKNAASRLTLAIKYFEKAFKDASLTDQNKKRYADAGLGYVALALFINPNLVDALVLKGVLLRVKAGATQDEKERNASLFEATLVQQDAKELRQAGKGEFSGAAMPDLGSPSATSLAPVVPAPPTSAPASTPPPTRGPVIPQQPTVLQGVFAIDAATGALLSLEPVKTKTDGGLSVSYTYIPGGSSPVTLPYEEPHTFATLDLSLTENRSEPVPFKLERLAVKDGKRYATKTYIALDAKEYGQPVPGLDSRKKSRMAYPHMYTPRERLAPGEYALTFFGLASGTAQLESSGGAFRVAEAQRSSTLTTLQAPSSGGQQFGIGPTAPQPIDPRTPPGSREATLDLFHDAVCGKLIASLCWHPGRLTISPDAIRWTESGGEGKHDFVASCDELTASKPYKNPTSKDFKSKGVAYGFDTWLKVGKKNVSLWFRLDERPDPPFDRVLGALRGACPGLRVKS